MEMASISMLGVIAALASWAGRKIKSEELTRRLARVSLGVWVFILATTIVTVCLLMSMGTVIYLSASEKEIPPVLAATLSGTLGYLGGISATTVASVGGQRRDRPQ